MQPNENLLIIDPHIKFVTNNEYDKRYNEVLLAAYLSNASIKEKQKYQQIIRKSRKSKTKFILMFALIIALYLVLGCKMLMLIS